MLTTENAAALVFGAAGDKDRTMKDDLQRVKITSGTVIKGKGPVPAGTTHTVDERTARELFAAGKAVPVELKPPKVSTRKKAAAKPKAEVKK